MSTTDPTGEGGGGGGGGGEESAMSTNVEQNASPSTPNTGTTVQATAQQQQQQQQHPPPSPLSGCYLLVVLPEPHTTQHKDLILNRLAKGFLSWDKDSCHVDLEKELLALVAQAPEGEEARNGERLIQYATENLVTEVLIHPQTNTLLQCIRNLLASFTKHRHIIHAGYTFGGNGSWILQDGTFSLADFLDAFSEHEVQRVLRAYENSVTVDIHCAGVGDWTTNRLSKETCCRFCRVRVNPDDVLTAGMPAITSFTNYIGQYLLPQTLDQLMEPSDVVGNIRFSHPTLYVFPGGQGDAALFGINGFNMLVDGGFARKACFWDFTRHLDRLDAVLITRINNSNIGGMFSVLQKKKELHVYPQIGHFFCNLVERRQSNSPDGDKDIDPLVLNLTDIGQEMVLNLRHINLRAHPCYRDSEPINLYHKVGHGTLDMYVLSPSKDSREVREFLSKWHASDSRLFAGSHKKDSNNLTFPIQNLVSICALLVWQPANPEDNITRILFPGSTPQHKIFEGFERLKHLDFLKHPVCSAKTLSPSTSLATLRDKPIKKFGLIEKKPSEPKKEKRETSESKSIKTTDEGITKTTPQSTPIIPTSKPKTEIKARKVTENKKIETETKESKKIEKELKEVKKESKKEPEKKDEIKKADLIKTESDKTAAKEIKEPKVKPELKKKEIKESKTTKTEVKKSEVTSKPKLSEKKTKLSGTEKKDAVKSSPTTPKKILNGTATKTEISKAPPKTKLAPKVIPSLPAKSAKEANNRKVVEQKKSEVAKSAVKDTAAPVVKMTAKPKPTDKKPINRRAKPVSPSKARMPGSPAKSTRSTPTTSVKSDKDGVIRKVKSDKGTTDSSTVSTPSGIEPEAVKPIEKSLIEQSEDMSLDSIESKVLADLKEEREVVEEIEAVLQKAERIEETRKDDRFEGDDEITAEATDKKEEDVTEEDVTAEIEDIPKKEGSRKESQELTEEDEYLIVEKEEVYTEDSAQSGEGEQKHVLDEAESEKAKILQDVETIREKGEKEEPEEKGKDESPEKKIDEVSSKKKKEIAGLSSDYKEQLQKEVKEIIASAAEIVQKAEEKDDSAKKDSEDITKEPSSLSPDKLDSSEKKTDTDKPDVDQKEHILEKREESQERISTIESGATTTAPTLPEDERIPLDEIKEDIDEKHVIEEVKEKDIPVKLKEEVIPETVSATAKPEVKVFDVRQAMQNLQRDIVKTPDEVADLPVHEEVDPKLYRMEDFEKGKEEKPSPTTQETKELSTPPVKEQKGVFSFFGKVADKFEKGIDKLTKKTKKEFDKDSDEKSSKSSSPKEPKIPEKTLFEEVDVEKMFPKVGKSADKPEIFEKMKPTIVDVKVATIKETATFIQEEILDAQKRNVSNIEEKLPIDKLEEIKKVEAEIEEVLLAKDVSPKPVDEEIAKEIELLKEDTGEDVEEVKALLEEASKKFKTVKDSLRDSLESLEEKVKEEDIQHEVSSTLKDITKNTLEGVIEKLEEIKPHIDLKEPEKVKFAIPKDEEFEEEYEEEPEGPYRDMKEAVRDIGEVLAGTAGIDLEDKPKDVTEIVKKVAEVLKEDDFLSHKVLFDQDSKKEELLSTPDKRPSKDEILPISIERKLSIPREKVSQEIDIELEENEPQLAHEDIATQKKVGITEVFPVHGEKPSAVEIKEKPCVKMIKKTDVTVTSPVKDVTKDKIDAQNICAEMLKDDQHICDQHKKSPDDHTCQVDVMQAGIESICVKETAKRPSLEDKLPESDIEHPVISFEQKVSPAKAELVMVTPGSTPTSPKFTADKMYDKELEIGLQELPKLPDDIKQVLSNEAPVEEVIEELIITKKKKITMEVIEYITVVKRIPKERVIYIIEEIIVKKGLPRESVVDDPEILKLKESITSEKRMEIENYIVNEYIVKGKQITIDIVEEISIKKVVPKKIIIEIIEEIIVKRKIARHMVFDIPDEVLSKIIKEESPEESPEESAEEQITPKIDITAKQESSVEISSAPTKVEELVIPQKRAEIEEFVINEYIIKGNKITTSIIDEISAKKAVPKKILIEIIEEIIIKKEIPKNVLLDITEEESDLLGISIISKMTPKDEEEKKVSETEVLSEKRKSIIEVPSAEVTEIKEPVTPQKRAEVEEYIVKEYVTKGDSINIEKLEEISGKKKMPKQIIIEIIEEIIIKRKMPRHIILGVTEEELSRIIKEEIIPEPEISAEKRKSVIEMLSSEKKKSPVELEEDKKENVPEREVNEEKLSEENVVEEEEEEEEIDGFVSIPRKSFDEIKTILPIKTEVLPVAARGHEKDVIDDFEAVEQEYKVRDVSITSPEKADEMKEKEDTEETVEDTTSEVIEADEKFVQETKEKVEKEELRIDVTKDIKSDDKKREREEAEASEISEIIDTTEKYLDEAKEKTDAKEKVEELITKDDKSKPITPVKDKTLKDIVSPIEEKVAEGVEPKTKLADATGHAQEPKTEILKDDIKSKSSEPTKITESTIVKDEVRSPTQELSEETLRKKSISKEQEDKVVEVKEEPYVKDVTKPLEKVKDEKSPADKSVKIDEDSGTVKRMLVTACSEDGREETEICPTGSITFTKIVTPDDSLKDISVKSTPDKDSLLLDKDLLHSSVTTPEKDSISEKSVPEDKDKITPEDSLEKSPIGIRDLQDLEDSLEKLKDVKIPPIDDNKPKTLEKSEESVEKIEESKSPVKNIEKTDKSPSPSEIKHEDTQKSKLPLDMTTEKSPIESLEKPKFIIEKTLSQFEKEETTDISKTPESHSEEVSPAETIFSKTPTEKFETYFAETLISKDVASEPVTKKSESTKEIKSTSPVSALDEKAPLEKSTSPSISSEKKDILSTSNEKSDDKELFIHLKSPVSDKGEKEDAVDESRSPSIISEPDKNISEAENKLEEKELMDKSKSPSIASEKSEQDIKSPDKCFSFLSDKAEEKETDKPKLPSAVEKETISEKSPILESEHYDEKGPIDEARSPSAISDRSDERKEAERSKSPSIATDKPELQDVMEHYLEKQKSPIFDRPESPKDIDKTEEQDKSRSPSVASDKSDSKKISSRSPSVSVEKVELKDMDLLIERARSPSVVSDKDDKLTKDAQKSPKLDETDVKDITQSLDKSRSSSVTSTISESKESVLKEKSPTGDKSKSPSPVEQKLDIGEKEPSEKSRSSSIVEEQYIPKEIKKSPSPVEEKLDLTQETIKKSRSSSVSSIVSDKNEPVEHSKSPNIIDEKPNLKDVIDIPDKSRSSSITSITGTQKKPADRSKSPSIAGEKPELKDVTQEPEERSKSPSIAGDKSDEKEPTADKSRSASVVSISSEQKETTDRSKSPSIADEKPDLKDVAEQQIEKLPSDKSRSPSEISDSKEPEERSKSSSIAGDKSDEKELTEDKSRSASVVSTTNEQKETVSRSKSPSVAGEKPDLKDVAEQQVEKLPSDKSDDKKSVGDSKSSSIAGDKSDLTDVTEHLTDKSKSPSVASITSEHKEIEKIKSDLDKKEDFDRSKSPGEKSEEMKLVISSKPSSIAGDTADLKDVSESPIDKSRSSSVVSVTTDQKGSIEKSVSPVAEQTIKDSHDRSKSPSIASEKSDSRRTSTTEDKPDLKDIIEPPTDKSRSPSIASLTTEKAEPSGKSISSTVSDKLEPPVDRSKSSTANDKSDEKLSDEKVGSKEYYEDTSDKSPNRINVKPSIVAKKLDIKLDDLTQSSSIVLDERPIEKIDIDELKTSSVIDQPELIDKERSLSIISDKTEPSLDDDKFDQKEKSRSSSIASDRLDNVDTNILSSLDIGKVPKDESAKSSRASSPSDKTPKDRSRSQSVFDIDDKAQSSRSRTASLFDDKLPEKILPSDEKDAFKHDTKKLLDEKDEDKSLPEEKKSPATSPSMIQKEMRKIREKRFADFKEPDTTHPSAIEKLDDEEENIVKVTAEKKAEIERYILEEFIIRKKKISLIVIEKLVMTYSVPQFIVMEIIEDIINRENVPKSAIFDFIDDESSKSQYEKEMALLPPQKKADVEKYITEEFITKKKKITSEMLEEIVILKSLPRDVIIAIIKEIIEIKHISRNTLIDLEELKERSESPDDKVSPAGSARDSKALSASPSLSPEPIPSDKSTQDSPARSEPHIDEEILLSEEKRIEIEKLLEEEYIKKGRKITEVILEEIIIRTSLPRYIILEIVEEIILKRKIPRESVIDVEIYQEEEPEEDYNKAVYGYDTMENVGYELPHDARKSSIEYRMNKVYSEPGERQLDKSDYPMDYESQFHKAFVGGMTEMRTTHITTLSGKSTPEFPTHDATPESGIEAADKASEKLLESTLTTTHITNVEDPKTVQTVTILRESKITEPHILAESPEKHEVIEKETKEIKQPSVQDEPEAITKIIKREIVEHDEPEVITKVVKREIIEQDEPEIITKVIRHEIVVPEEETSDSKEDSGEYIKTITTKTTRTIVTEELPNAELSQTDPSKIYTDSTSGTTYRIVSDESAPDTSSADVKRIVTTVTTITDPDGKVTTKKDVEKSIDTVDSEKLLEELIDSGKITTETAKSAEKIIKETITTVTSGTSTPDPKIYDSGKSTPDFKQDDKFDSTVKERLGTDKFEPPVSPLVRDLISDDRSYSGKSSPDMSLPKDIVFSGSTGKSTPEIPMSPLIRDGAAVQPHLSGRSTPDRRSESRSSTGTPEGFRSGEMIRTTITTTKMISDEGEIVTTTREVTETTNEKGETVVVAEKTDVKVDERLPSKDADSAISSIIGSIKSSESQRGGSPASDDATSDKTDRSTEHSGKVMTQTQWGSSEERHTYSDDEPPSSPLSSTSQVGYSPQTTRRHEPPSDKEEEQKEQQIEFSAAAMSSSFYGELPAVPAQISAMKTFHGETGMQTSSDPVHSRFMVEKEFTSYSEKPDAKRYVDEADLDFDKALMEHKEMKEANGVFSSGIAPRYTNGSLRHETDDAKDHPSSSFRDDKDDSKGDSKKDPLDGWGSPLGLPSPKPPRKFNLKSPAQASCSSESTSDILNFDVLKDWGEPLRLPSPAPTTNEISNKGTPATPKKERKQTKKVQSENIKNKKSSESPSKNEKRLKDSKNKIQPVYMDLAYVPHHGNSYYTSLEFFKRVRARYYVFSGTEPSREVYDALLEAKKTWEDKDLEVTMIPTYDTDTLGYWVADNEEALAANHIDLSPSASRCTINLQDHETSCSAYRLEF